MICPSQSHFSSRGRIAPASGAFVGFMLFLSVSPVTAVSPVEPPSIRYPMTTECEFYAADTIAYGAAGAKRFRLDAGAGTIRVVGKAGLKSVRIHTRRCASQPVILEQLWFDLSRTEDTIMLKVRVPKHLFSRNVGTEASVDLKVEVPEEMAIDLRGGTGGVWVSQTGPLTLEDALGDVTVADVRGNVRIKVGPDSVNVRNVQGDVSLDVRVGAIVMQGAEGGVSIGAGHRGPTSIRDVKGSVSIGERHSGDISIDGVGGDLSIAKLEEGTVRHANVKGKVTNVPRS